MKPKTTLILLGITAAVFAFIWFQERHWETTDQKAGRAKRVFDLKSGDVTNLVMQVATTNYTGRIVLAKEKDKWWMREPLAVRASGSEANRITSGLESLDRQDAITPQQLKEKGGKLSDYGLDKPQVEFTFLQKNQPTTIKLGKPAPVGNSVYIQVSGNKDILVVGKELLTDLDRKLDDLRERTLVEFNTYQATRLEVTQGKKTIEMVKAAKPGATDKVWQLAQPIKARADQSKVDGLASKLNDLKAETFVTEKPADLKTYDLDQPQLEVTLYTSEQEGAITVQFGGALKDDAAKVYCKRKGVDSIYAVKGDILKDFTLQVNDLRDKKLADFAGDDAREIAISFANQTLRLAKDKEDWKLTEPEATKADNSEVGNLLTNLTGLEVKEFVADVVTDPAKYGLDRPYYTVIVKKEAPAEPAPAASTGSSTNAPAASAGAKVAASTNAPAATASAPAAPKLVTLIELQFGKEDKDKKLVYVKRADEPYVYAVESDGFGKLPKTALTLRNRTLIATEKSKVTKLVSIAGAAKVAVEKKDDKWKLAAGVQGVLDTNALDDVLWTVTGLNAEKFVSAAAADQAQYGVDKPARVLNFEVSDAGTNKTFELSLGKETADKGRYGLLRGQPQIFELSASTTSSLTKDLLKRPETNVPPAKVTAPAPAAKPPAKK
ncbi:MAG: DUF4340 domain-containing protein [Verrucomicrobia bacterium]|nr:DUF4340 domain-containing protein [Verrucomicrobiota bacterium]